MNRDQINAVWEEKDGKKVAVVTRVSPLTGKENTMRLDITQAQFTSWIKGCVIQRAMPNLTPDEREFVMTGYTREDWQKMFPEEK
jgi:hypothetical protein